MNFELKFALTSLMDHRLSEFAIDEALRARDARPVFLDAARTLKTLEKALPATHQLIGMLRLY